MRTMYEALRICAPITLMTFAIFTRPEMVVTPGWGQVMAAILVLVGTSGVAFAMFGRFLENLAADIPIPIALAAAVSFAVRSRADHAAEVEVDDREVRILGRKDVLEQAVIANAAGWGEVRSFVPKWLGDKDSNLD